ncbi:TPA: D-alanyl-D-alanine carboxypeptidase PBP3 [Streptococcus suis]
MIMHRFPCLENRYNLDRQPQIRRMILKIAVSIVILFFSLLSLSKEARAEEYTANANQALAIEVSSGKILYEKDSETPVPVASLGKLLGIYLVYESIKKGEIDVDTPVSISDYPFQLTTNPNITSVILDYRLYSVNELIHAALISSSNSAMIALAEKIAGSEAAFVDRMRAKLQEWEISDAKIVNSTGLDNSYLGENIYPGSSETDTNTLSALDLAIIARRLILDFPVVLEVTSLLSYTIDGYSYYSYNQMVQNGIYERGGVDGLKTAASESAGVSFIATTKQANMRILTILLNVQNGLDTPENRFIETNRLMDYIYSTFTYTTLVKKGEAYENSKIKVFNGAKETSPVVAATDLSVVQRNHTDKPASATFTTNIDEIQAPAEAGENIGTLQLEDTDLIGKGYIADQASIDMILPNKVKKAPWPVSWWNNFVRYVNEKL